MKLAKTTRQNLILLVLTLTFFFVSKWGVDDITANGMESIGLFILMVGGIPFLGFSIAFIVRLWDMD